MCRGSTRCVKGLAKAAVARLIKLHQTVREAPKSQHRQILHMRIGFSHICPNVLDSN